MDRSTEPVFWRGTVSHPVGINRTYSVGSGTDGKARMYVDRDVRARRDQLNLELRAAGLQALPPTDGMWWIAVRLSFFTHRHDVDAVIKGVCDEVATVIGWDDAAFGHVDATKVPVKKKDERLVVRVIALPVRDMNEFRAMALRCLSYDAMERMAKEMRNGPTGNDTNG